MKKALLSVSTPTAVIIGQPKNVPDASWVLFSASLGKRLLTGGTVPLDTPVASITPTDAPLVITSHIDYNKGVDLPDGTPVVISHNDLTFSQTTGIISNPDTGPTATGKDILTIQADWPEGTHLAPTQTVSCTVVLDDRQKVISVPKNALQLTADGTWTIELKDGDSTKTQTIRRGKSNKDRVEILSGLEAGQTIIVPD